MSVDQDRLSFYFGHVKTALDRIDTYLISKDYDAFLADTLLQDAVIRNLEILGEASRNCLRHLPQDMPPEWLLPFRNANDMRNVLAHG